MKGFRTVLSALALAGGMFAGTASIAQEAKPNKITEPLPPQSEIQSPQKGMVAPMAEAKAPVTDPPEAVVAEMTFDAGTVSRGSVIKHDFVIENRGKGTLEISRVHAACGCTVTEYDRKIEPGKQGKITASVSTAAFSGPIHKTINVVTSDPKLSSFQLGVKAVVKSILSVQPSENQQLGLVFKGQAQEKTFTLTSEDGTPFEVTSVQADDAALQWDIKMAEDKKSATFKVVLPADHAVGPINGRFVLATSHPKVDKLNLNLFGTIRDPLTVYPPQVMYSGLNRSYVNEHPEDINLNKTVTVAFEMGPELQITNVTSTLKNLTAEIQTITPNQRYSIKLKLVPPLELGPIDATLTVETSKGPVTIPVRGKVF
jgi:hypothetical protein